MFNSAAWRMPAAATLEPYFDFLIFSLYLIYLQSAVNKNLAI